MAEMCRKCGSAVGSLRHAAACGVTNSVTPVTNSVTPVTNSVTLAEKIERVIADPEAIILSEHVCPTCGQLHRVVMTNRERQKAYRERKRG